MQPYLTPFWIGNHSVVPWSSCTLAIYSVCRSRISTVKCLGIPTLLMLFHIFRCCTLSKSFVWSIKQFDIFVVLPCSVHDSRTLAICSLAPSPFRNPNGSIGVSYSVHDSSCFWIILRRILFSWGNSAMVQLFVNFVTSFLGEGMKIDIRCFTCPWFRRNV